MEAFSDFKKWVTKHGPFNAVIDAANVAMAGSERSRSGVFSIAQLSSTVRHVRDTCGMKTLVILHKRWVCKMREGTNEDRAHLADIESSLYTPKSGVNDDWYWLYAAVLGGEKSYVISNDLMRDHKHNLQSASVESGAPPLAFCSNGTPRAVSPFSTRSQPSVSKIAGLSGAN